MTFLCHKTSLDRRPDNHPDVIAVVMYPKKRERKRYNIADVDVDARSTHNRTQLLRTQHTKTNREIWVSKKTNFSSYTWAALSMYKKSTQWIIMLSFFLLFFLHLRVKSSSYTNERNSQQWTEQEISWEFLGDRNWFTLSELCVCDGWASSGRKSRCETLMMMKGS